MIEEDKLNALELFGENEYLHKEIERLHSIIKEVREYVETHYLLPNDKGILEILDKENI